MKRRAEMKIPVTEQVKIQDQGLERASQADTACVNIVQPSLLGTATAKDARFYIKLMGIEVDYLLTWTENAEKILMISPKLSLDIADKLHSVIHQAKVLVNSKLRHFEVLCRKNLVVEGKAVEGDKAPTVDDLGKQWDSIFLDIEHVGRLFTELEELRQRDWIQLCPAVLSPRPVCTTAKQAPRVEHELRVKRLEEAQRLIKLSKKCAQSKIKD